MDIDKLEKEIFIQKTKNTMVSEALSNCKAIVADAFSDDINDLRSEFPPEVKSTEDIAISFQSMRVNIAHSVAQVPSLEIVITMQDPHENVLGYYMMILDENLSCIDEHFVLE